MVNADRDAGERCVRGRGDQTNAPEFALNIKNTGNAPRVDRLRAAGQHRVSGTLSIASSTNLCAPLPAGLAASGAGIAKAVQISAAAPKAVGLDGHVLW